MRRLPPLVLRSFRKFAELMRPSGMPKLRVFDRVEHLDADLDVLSVCEPRVLHDPEVDVDDAVRTQRVARHVANALAGACRARIAAQRTEQAAPPAARISSTVMFDRSRSVLRFGRIALPTRPSMPASAPVGSEPFSTVNGAPLWSVKNELICQPPSDLARRHPAGRASTAAPRRSCRSAGAGDRRWSAPCHREVERVLRHGHLAARRIEDLRRRVLEAAPGVVDAGAQAAAEALVELRLQRVVPRLGGVGAQPDDAARRILRAAVLNGSRGLPSSVWNRSLPNVPT